ncbi:GTPase activating protein (GAP) for Rho1p [Coemansia brasiliensis]|uniref:GTPase activating protein (GAP) for Rho1p n=1 Tax=Coemansia brasiliensis TaxID=2650707 RepID=A0A9W8M1P8_9FUNG|nr:GTPase activating protein (GAP) for Rho1p [Coemansia brasiliensis]
MNENNMLRRSEQNVNEALGSGWQRNTSISAAAASHTISPSWSSAENTHKRSQQHVSGPQTVTARIVDPSASDELAYSQHPLASASADYSPRHNSLYGGYSPSMHYYKNQQQQPTLAALALADSRGQLDSGLGHYYQHPHRLRADARNAQGFCSEPVSEAGSPVCSISSSSARMSVGRGAASVDSAVLGAGMSPGASALGVMFPPGATKTTADSVVQRGRSSSRRSSRDSSQYHQQQHSEFGASAGRHEAVAGRQRTGSGDVYAHGAPASTLTALPEGGTLEDNFGANGNNRRHMGPNAELTPQPSLPSTPSASAASLTAASSSFSFRNQRSYHQTSYSISSQQSQQQQQQQQQGMPQPGSSIFFSSNRHSTAVSNRDSMFLRFKEKMRALKPRSRPQSDNLTDRRPQGFGPQPTGISGSPSQKHPQKSPSSELQLFGMPLAYAVKVAGVRVGRVAASGEACIVPTVVAVCGRHLWALGQQTQGIFRVNGSMRRVQMLQSEFDTPPAYGRHIEWSTYTLHDAATMLRRYLTSLPESVISSDHYRGFMDKLAEPISDDAKAHDFGVMIEQLVPECRHTLLYMLELLAGFAQEENSEKTRMSSSNLAAVLQPCLLVHPDHVANPQEYSKAKDVVEFLIVHAAEIYPSGSSNTDGEASSGAAGLIIFDADDAQSVEGEPVKGVASDDGTTLDACANEIHTGQTQQQRHSRLSAEGTQETKSRDSMTEAQPKPELASNDETPGEMQSGHTVPPRGDSLVNTGMVMSTPVISSTVAAYSGQPSTTHVRSLGSVTARLYDPESPQEPTGSQQSASHSNIRLNSIQYQYTAPPLSPPSRIRETRADSASAVDSGGMIGSPPAARPRRSLSFMAGSPTSPIYDASETTYSRIDESTQDMINRSSNAVRARRGAAERRAGHINVSADGAAASTQLGLGYGRSKKLPPIPQRVVSAAASISIDYSENQRPKTIAEESKQHSNELKPRRPAAAVSAATFDSSTGYSLYPSRLQAASTPTSNKASNANYTQSSYNQPYSSAGGQGRGMAWLSEDVPEDEYEFIGGRRSKHANAEPNDEHLRQGAEMAAAAAALTEAQQQKLHPVGQIDSHMQQYATESPANLPTSMPSEQAKLKQQQQQQQRGVVSADNFKDKTSMTRLKNIFRMGHGGKNKLSNAENSSESSLKPALPPISNPRLMPGTFQHQPNSIATFGGLTFNGKPATTGSMSAVNRDVPPPPPPQQPVESAAAARLQVAVPAGHLSIVYPDSPMSKADTLGRASAESTKRVSMGVSSGHAYLVNPDDSKDDEETYQGTDLHQTPSNSTTLRPNSHIHKQQQFVQRPGQQYTGSSATFVGRVGIRRDSNVLGEEDGSNLRRLYGVQRMADSDTQIDRRMQHAKAPEAFVLPNISNGSPLLPAGMEFDSPTVPAHPQTPYRRSRMNVQQSVASWKGDDEEELSGNSPRRSRSLRNTITSLRRKLSKSSRNGAVNGSSPDTSMEEAPTTSVH